MGRKNIPVFRIVLTESQNSAKSGRYLEVLGTYDPVHNIKEIDAEKVKDWMKKGAQLSNTVYNFLIDKKIIEGKKVNALPKKKPIKKEEKEGDKGAKTPVALNGTPATEAVKESVAPAEAPKS